MASVNKVILIGNLGAEPELKYLPSGQAVCEVSLACNETWTDKQGQKQEWVEWVRCVMWGKTAENVAKYCQKGKQLYVEGQLRTESWEDKETKQKRYATKVNVRDVKFLGARSDGDGGGRAAPPARRSPPSGNQQRQDDYGERDGPPPVGPGAEEDDIPF